MKPTKMQGKAKNGDKKWGEANPHARKSSPPSGIPTVRGYKEGGYANVKKKPSTHIIKRLYYIYRSSYFMCNFNPSTDEVCMKDKKETKDKHSMIVMLDPARADVYKTAAKAHGKCLSSWVRIILDRACRKQGLEPESVILDDNPTV